MTSKAPGLMGLMVEGAKVPHQTRIQGPTEVATRTAVSNATSTLSSTTSSFIESTRLLLFGPTGLQKLQELPTKWEEAKTEADRLTLIFAMQHIKPGGTTTSDVIRDAMIEHLDKLNPETKEAIGDLNALAISLHHLKLGVCDQVDQGVIDHFEGVCMSFADFALAHVRGGLNRKGEGDVLADLYRLLTTPLRTGEETTVQKSFEICHPLLSDAVKARLRDKCTWDIDGKDEMIATCTQIPYLQELVGSTFTPKEVVECIVGAINRRDGVTTSKLFELVQKDHGDVYNFMLDAEIKRQGDIWKTAKADKSNEVTGETPEAKRTSYLQIVGTPTMLRESIKDHMALNVAKDYLLSVVEA